MFVVHSVSYSFTNYPVVFVNILSVIAMCLVGMKRGFRSIMASRKTSPWCVGDGAVKNLAEGRDENPNVLVSVTCRQADTQDGVALRNGGVADRTDHEAATSQLSLSCDSTRFRSNGDPDNRTAIMGGRGRDEVSFGQEATCLGDVGLKTTDPTCVSS